MTRSHDDLRPDDYRRLVAVLEAAAEARSRTDLRDRLLSALAREFGWTGTFRPEGETPPAATDLLRIHVAGGTATIGVPLDRPADRREHAISRCLGRLLAPAFRAHAADEPARGDQWSLTDREREIAALVAAGLTNRQLAEHLHVTVDTVKKHMTSVLKKTGCTSRTHLAVLWRRPASS